MKKKLIFILAFFVLVVNFLSADSTTSQWGASGAKNKKNLSINDMLKYAIEDEYLARAEYLLIMKKFGKIAPFSNIVKSEEQHIVWLKQEYDTRKLSIPEDNADQFVVLPESLKESFETGVHAEIENIAMYTSFLSSPRLAARENSELKTLFTRLMQASENHLKAFKRNLAKY